MAKSNEKRIEESAYPRYDWWNEMRCGWDDAQEQPAQMNFGQVEMLQRNRMEYLMDVMEGKDASPFVAAPALGWA